MHAERSRSVCGKMPSKQSRRGNFEIMHAERSRKIMHAERSRSVNLGKYPSATPGVDDNTR